LQKIKLAKQSELVYLKTLQYGSEANRLDRDFVLKIKKRSEHSFFFKTKGKKRKCLITNYQSFAIATRQSPKHSCSLPEPLSSTSSTEAYTPPTWSTLGQLSAYDPTAHLTALQDLQLLMPSVNIYLLETLCKSNYIFVLTILLIFLQAKVIQPILGIFFPFRFSLTPAPNSLF
jgi:hypothetical protein